MFLVFLTLLSIVTFPQNAKAATTYSLSKDHQTITSSDGEKYVFKGSHCGYNWNGTPADCKLGSVDAYLGSVSINPFVGSSYITVNIGIASTNPDYKYSGKTITGTLIEKTFANRNNPDTTTISIKIPAEQVAESLIYTWKSGNPATITDSTGRVFTVTQTDINKYTSADGNVLVHHSNGSWYLNNKPTPVEVKNSPMYGTTMTKEEYDEIFNSTDSDPCETTFIKKVGATVGVMIGLPQGAIAIAACNATITMVNFLQTSISNLGKWLSYLLNMPARMMDDPTSPIQDAWKSILNVTLSLLTLALVVIAMANILNVDEKLGYGLNRMIPKIIISIVMALLSFLIARILLDFASALQNELFNLSAKLGSADMANSALSTASEIKRDALSIPFLLFLTVVLVLLFLSILWLTILLIVRVAMIWILVALAPAAMLMNILPFTESFYKMWWKEWWKWLFMGPAVAVMLYLASVLLEAFQKAFTTGTGFEAFLVLIMAAVCIFLAGTIPLTMGGKVMAAASKPFQAARKGINKAATAPATDRWKQFQTDRGLYRKQKIRKDVSGLRGKISSQGGVGRVVAGTGGLRQKPGFMGTDLELAVMAEGETIKTMGEKEKLSALQGFNSKGGATAAAEAGDARAIAIMQSLAKETHTSGYTVRDEGGNVVDDTAQVEIAKAVGSSNPNLGVVQAAIKGNPNSDWARDLVNAPTSTPEKLGTEKYLKLTQEASKKSAGKTTFETDYDDIKALEKISETLTNLSTRGIALDARSQDALKLSNQTIDKHKQFFRDNNNYTAYVQKTTPKRQEEHAKAGPDYTFKQTPPHQPSEQNSGHSESKFGHPDGDF